MRRRRRRRAIAVCLFGFGFFIFHTVQRILLSNSSQFFLSSHFPFLILYHRSLDLSRSRDLTSKTWSDQTLLNPSPRIQDIIQRLTQDRVRTHSGHSYLVSRSRYRCLQIMFLPWGGYGKVWTPRATVFPLSFYYHFLSFFLSFVLSLPCSSTPSDVDSSAHTFPNPSNPVYSPLPGHKSSVSQFPEYHIRTCTVIAVLYSGS